MRAGLEVRALAEGQDLGASGSLDHDATDHDGYLLDNADGNSAMVGGRPRRALPAGGAEG
ncbi:hypothetical protein GCM10009696_18700 [Kocuria himachalensis]